MAVPMSIIMMGAGYFSSAGVGDDVGAQLLAVELHADIQTRFDAGAYHHGGLAQQAGQGLLHHEVDGRHHTGKDGAADVVDVAAVQRKQVHQIDADLVRRLAAVRVQRRQKTQFPRLVKQAHGNVGIADVNG